MTDKNAFEEFKEGVGQLKNGYAGEALVHLRRAVELERRNPYYLSFLGLSIARAEKKWTEASILCETALQLKRNEVQLYLNLAEVYAAAGRRENAANTLDQAMEKFSHDNRIRKARGKVQSRRSPVLPFLEREHFLNRGLGKLRHRALAYLQKS